MTTISDIEMNKAIIFLEKALIEMKQSLIVLKNYPITNMIDSDLHDSIRNANDMRVSDVNLLGDYTNEDGSIEFGKMVNDVLKVAHQLYCIILRTISEDHVNEDHPNYDDIQSKIYEFHARLTQLADMETNNIIIKMNEKFN